MIPAFAFPEHPVQQDEIPQPPPLKDEPLSWPNPDDDEQAKGEITFLALLLQSGHLVSSPDALTDLSSVNFFPHFSHIYSYNGIQHLQIITIFYFVLLINTLSIYEE